MLGCFRGRGNVIITFFFLLGIEEVITRLRDLGSRVRRWEIGLRQMVGRNLFLRLLNSPALALFNKICIPYLQLQIVILTPSPLFIWELEMQSPNSWKNLSIQTTSSVQFKDMAVAPSLPRHSLQWSVGSRYRPRGWETDSSRGSS